MQPIAEPVVQQSYPMWFLSAIGPSYGIALAVAGFASFFLSTYVAFRGKGAMAAGALVLLVPMPFLVGIFGALDATIGAYSVIAVSEAPVKAREIVQGISSALAIPLAGLALMVPGYLVATLASIFRSAARDAAKA